jgi:hypothetical protein
MQRRRRVVAVLATLAATLALGAGSAAAADWVGLGDSYAAGPLIPNQQLNPHGQHRPRRLQVDLDEVGRALIPTNAAAPFHPNARGEAGVAAVIVGA